MVGACELQFSSLSSTGSLALLFIFFLRLLSLSLLFFYLHQCLDSVARCAVQCNRLVARRTHRLGGPWTLGGNTHLEYFMDGLPETVEVVVY